MDLLNKRPSSFNVGEQLVIEQDLREGKAGKETIESVLRYISSIDFNLSGISLAVTQLSPSFELTFDQQLFNKNDSDNIIQLP